MSLDQANSASCPLQGRRIVITRAREQSGELRDKLAALGATVIELPLIEIVSSVDPRPRRDFRRDRRLPVAGLHSPNGVRFFFSEFFRRFRDIRAIGGARFAAVGPAPRRSCTRSLDVDVMPKSTWARRWWRRCAPSSRWRI
jgi:uroporphyrinogen III methyltransferase/synthase